MRVFLECLIDERKNEQCDQSGCDEPSDDDCGQRPLNLCSRTLGQKKGILIHTKINDFGESEFFFFVG